MNYLNQIVNADCRVALSNIPDNSIHLVITSPPYGRLRQYSDLKADLGNLEIDEQFDELVKISKEIYRVLASGRKFILFFMDLVTKIDGNTTLVSPIAELVPGILDIGFILKNIFIWKKPNSWSRMRPGGTAPYPASPIIQPYFEYIIVFQKKGKADYSYVSAKTKTESVFPIKDITKNGGVFDDNPDESKKLHPAPFPLSLIKKLIMMFSFVNDIVLDPFAGSGTVAVACKELRRNFIAIELNERYCNIIKQRLDHTMDLWSEVGERVKILKLLAGKTQNNLL